MVKGIDRGVARRSTLATLDCALGNEYNAEWAGQKSGILARPVAD
jgi:hypothetical protein